MQLAEEPDKLQTVSQVRKPELFFPNVSSLEAVQLVWPDFTKVLQLTDNNARRHSYADGEPDHWTRIRSKGQQRRQEFGGNESARGELVGLLFFGG